MNNDYENLTIDENAKPKSVNFFIGKITVCEGILFKVVRLRPRDITLRRLTKKEMEKVAERIRERSNEK